MTAGYDYLFLSLERGRAAHGALAMHLKGLSGGGEVLGQFAPQLGWRSNEAAVLVRWPSAEKRSDAASAIAGGAVMQVATRRLTPTLRPGDADSLKPGGIYVHRWFEVDADAADEFVALSGQGWKNFEAEFDANIFGLFRAAPDEEDEAAKRVSFLLVTRYGSHGVWEASRNPATEAMGIFMRRHELTQRTWGASSLLVES